jgi:hypothetical protein
MAIAYDGINYFPVGVNFMEENAMEVIEGCVLVLAFFYTFVHCL